MTSFLVTGGASFIGAALVNRLVRDGHTVRVLDICARGQAVRLAGVMADIEYVETDVRCRNQLTKAALGMESIIHLAQIGGASNACDRPELVLDVGVRGMLRVLDLCRRVGIGELFVASSPVVYQTLAAAPADGTVALSAPADETVALSAPADGTVALSAPADETVALSVPDPANPCSSHAGSRLICELMALNYGRTDFDRVVVFRPHGVYGPGMGWNHMIPRLVEQAVDQVGAHPHGPVPFPIQGDGRQTCAFMHIDDFTDAMALLIERARHLNIYHVGNPEELAVAEVARRIVALFGREARIEAGSPAPGFLPDTPLRRCPDIGKLLALGFVPRIPFSVGLPGVVDGYAASLGRRARVAAAS